MSGKNFWIVRVERRSVTQTGCANREEALAAGRILFEGGCGVVEEWTEAREMTDAEFRNAETCNGYISAPSDVGARPGGAVDSPLSRRIFDRLTDLRRELACLAAYCEEVGGASTTVARELLAVDDRAIDQAVADLERRAGEAQPRRVLVHADGGDCDGTPLVDGQCPKCGLYPDMQSTEFRRIEEVAR